MRARRASSRKLGWRAVGTRCARSCAKRSIGRSWVVPWIRTSAMVTLHSVSCSWRSTSSTKVRPGRKLPLKYFTPDSTLPLVWARYGWQSRGSKLQYSAKALKVAFQGNAAVRGAETHRARPIIEMLAGVAAEILEGPLVRIEKLWQPLVRADVVVTPPTEA